MRRRTLHDLVRPTLGEAVYAITDRAMVARMGTHDERSARTTTAGGASADRLGVGARFPAYRAAARPHAPLTSAFTASSAAVMRRGEPMQEQSNGDIDFGWVQRKILEGLAREGFNEDFLESLRTKIAAV